MYVQRFHAIICVHIWTHLTIFVTIVTLVSAKITQHFNTKIKFFCENCDTSDTSKNYTNT